METDPCDAELTAQARALEISQTPAIRLLPFSCYNPKLWLRAYQLPWDTFVGSKLPKDFDMISSAASEGHEIGREPRLFTFTPVQLKANADCWADGFTKGLLNVVKEFGEWYQHCCSELKEELIMASRQSPWLLQNTEWYGDRYEILEELSHNVKSEREALKERLSEAWLAGFYNGVCEQD